MGTSRARRLRLIASVVVAMLVAAACAEVAPPPSELDAAGADSELEQADGPGTQTGPVASNNSGSVAATGAAKGAASDGTGGPATGEPATGAGNPSYPDSGVTESEILIGAVYPLTSGFASQFENQQFDTVQRWFDFRVNSRELIHGRRVKFIYYDDGFDPNKGSQVVKKLVEEDKVLAIVLPVSTFTLETVRAYVEEHGVSILVPDGYQPASYESEYYYPTSNFFDRQGYKIGHYLTCTLGHKRIGVWNANTAGGSKRGGDAMVKAVEECGGTVVDREEPGSFETNYQPYVVRMRAANPDAVGSALNPLGDGFMTSSAKQQGWKPEGGFMHVAASVGATFEGLGSWADKTRAVIDFQFGSAGASGHAGLREWVEWLRSRGVDPDTRFASQVWTGVELFRLAALRAGPHLNRQSFKEALDTLPPADLGVTCTPIVFGKGAHDPNDCLRVVKWDPEAKVWNEEAPFQPVPRQQ